MTSTTPGRRVDLAAAITGRRRAQMVAGLRGLATRPGPGGQAPPSERCDLCGSQLASEHRHLLDLHERSIACVCESCWAIRAGDPNLCPVGTRTLWLSDFVLPDDLWGQLRIPIGLAFFMVSSATGGAVALYPSPAGATESELALEAWERLAALHPALEQLQPDAEGLIVNRLADPPVHVIAPIDRCYELVGRIRAGWEGISGGPGVQAAIDAFFEALRAAA